MRRITKKITVLDKTIETKPIIEFTTKERQILDRAHKILDKASELYSVVEGEPDCNPYFRACIELGNILGKED